MMIERALLHIKSQLQQGQCNNTTFYSSLIANALEDCNDVIACAIKKDCALFLLKQHSDQWSYNYWATNALEYTTKPYPDDLDDTFAALTALYHVMPSSIDEKTWKCIMELLIHNEVSPGGPYQTWILNTEKDKQLWHDIDIVVNACIANFLTLAGITIPRLIDYIDAAIEQDNLLSKYYHQEYIILYFITNNYKGRHRDILIQKILALQHMDGHWHTPLATALCTTALLRIGYQPDTLKQAINFLIQTEQDGQWQSEPFFIESISGSEITYSTCSAHCSACVVEAITLYQKTVLGDSTAKLISDQNIYCTTVIEECKSHMNGSSAYIQQQFETSLQSLAIKDPDSEIVLLSYNFFQSLKPEYRKNISSPLVLSTANTFGWIGYSIIDTVLDGEHTISQLPLAITCIRKSAALFLSQTQDKNSEEIVQEILTGIENSVAWEQSATACSIINNCLLIPSPLPDYGNYTYLAAKSLGHALGPLLLCLAVQEVGQAMLLKQFFTHYLIAKQLHDDAHDWLDDLKQGFVNSVAVGVITLFKILYPDNSTLHIKQDQEILQNIFWKQHIDAISTEIISHCHKARALLSQLVVTSNTDYLESLLEPLERSAQKAIIERDKTMTLLTLIAV